MAHPWVPLVPSEVKSIVIFECLVFTSYPILVPCPSERVKALPMKVRINKTSQFKNMLP